MSWYQSDINYTPSEPYVPPMWSTGTDEEIVAALQKHYDGEIDLTEYWSIGDERTVSLSAMSALSSNVNETHVAQDVTFILTAIGGKTLADGVTECAFQVDQKNCLLEKGRYISGSLFTTEYPYNTSERRTWCNSTYYNAIPETLRPIFKEFINKTSSIGGVIKTENDYFALRAASETLPPSISSSGVDEGDLIWYYNSPRSNRIKYINGTATAYWLRTRQKDSAYTAYMYYAAGETGLSYAETYTNYGLAPFGVI